MKSYKKRTVIISAIVAAASIFCGTFASAETAARMKYLINDDISWATSENSSDGYVSEKNSNLPCSDNSGEVNENYTVSGGTTGWKAFNGVIGAKGSAASHGNLRVGVTDLVLDMSYTFSADIMPSDIASAVYRNSAGIKFDASSDVSSYYILCFEDPGARGLDAYKVSLRKCASGDTSGGYGTQRLAYFTLGAAYRNISQNDNRPFTFTVTVNKEDGENVIDYEIKGTKSDGSREVIKSGTYTDKSPLSGSQVLLYKTGETPVYFDNISVLKIKGGLEPATLPFYDTVDWGTAENPTGGYSAAPNYISYGDDAGKVNNVYRVFPQETYWKAYNGKISAKGNRYNHGNLTIGPTDFVGGISYNFSVDIDLINMADTRAQNAAGIKFNANPETKSFYSLIMGEQGAEDIFRVTFRKTVGASESNYFGIGDTVLDSFVLPEEYRNIGSSENRPFRLSVSVLMFRGKKIISYEVTGTKEDKTKECLFKGSYDDTEGFIQGGQISLYKAGQSETMFDNILAEETVPEDILISGDENSCNVTIDIRLVPGMSVSDSFMYVYYDINGRKIQSGRVTPEEQDGKIKVCVPKNKTLGAKGRLYIWHGLAPRIESIALN